MTRFGTMILAGMLLAAAVAPNSSSAEVSVGVSVNIGPPALPYYPQPICPGVGYIWAPGYWSYGPYGYYWVPGTWVLAPAVGLLWTPGYWGWRGGFYWWHPGYWGPHVGFYGGINYGYGYVGVGYVGGYWRGGAFYYNRAASNVNVTYIHNTYNQTVVNNTTRISYNGGVGGTAAIATAEQESFAREPHTPATAAQTQHEHTALNNPGQRFSANNGRPQIAATEQPGKFNGNGAVRMNEKGDAYAYHPAHQANGAHPRGQRPAHAQRAPHEHHGGGGGERHHPR
jgi:hypothetical protein